MGLFWYDVGMKLKPDLYFITGMSGSGKTTIGRRLIEFDEVAFDSKIQQGLFHFADKDGNQPTDYLPNNADWMEKYHWVLDKPMFDNLMHKYKDAKRVFLCGGADDIKQYWPLGQKVFMLEIDAKTMIQRLNSNDRDNNFGKDKQTQLLLLEKIKRFQNRQINEGAVAINAMRPIDDVVKDILSQVS
jgi:shikimate kinase